MPVNTKDKRLIWISPLILDVDFHKTTQTEVLRALTKRGYETFLVASYSSKKTTYEQSALHTLSFPVRYIPFVSTIAYVFLVFLFLPFFLLRYRPNVVIVEPLTAVHGAEVKAFSKFLKTKVVLDIRSGPVGKSGLALGLSFNLGIGLAKKLFDGITTITPLSKELLCRRFDIETEIVGVWTSGVSTELFVPQPNIGNEMRKKLGLAGKFVVFYHGSFGSPEIPRGLVETIKAVGLLGNKYSDIVLFLLGTGSIDLMNIANAIGVKERVIIHAPVDYHNVPKYIAMCDVGIVPLPNLSYWRHQCPLNLLEYLAMNKMVIANDIPANRNILDNSKCAVFTSSSDPQKIADAIIKTYEHRNIISTLGALGRTIVENEFSWNAVSRNLDAYLAKLQQ
jgi:glycosyltransferase involved in cell wall biosynthesis